MNIAPAIGHNSPPSAIEDAQSAFTSLSAFLTDMPVVETEDQAREIKLHIDRASIIVKCLVDEREAETKPLYSAWQSAINKFKPSITNLERLVDVAKARLATFMRAEEDRRLCHAQAKRLEAEEAIRIAREAENAESEARDNASHGECVDIGAAIELADSTFAKAKKLDHQASIAERDANVRIGSAGLGRVASLKTKETLILQDPLKAIISIGVTQDIKEAILKSARAYRKLHNKLPAGIKIEQTRSL